MMLILSSCEPNMDEDTSLLRIYGDALDDIGFSIAKTDGGYLIGGQFTEVVREGNYINVDSSKKKMGIIRTDINGNLLWKRSFGDDKDAVGSKVIVLSDGSFAATGYIIYPGKNQKDVFVVKISADGKNFTQRNFGGEGNQLGIDILQTPEGFIVLGSTDLARGTSADSAGNASGKKDIYLLRINNNLEPIGTPKVSGYWGNENPAAIKKDLNEGYVIVGTTDNSWPSQGLNNIFILKIKLNGEPSGGGIRILGTTEDEYASDFEILDDGYLITGVVGSDGTEQQVYIAKVPEQIFGSVTVIPKFKVISASSISTSFSVNAINRYATDSFVMAGQAGFGASAKMLIFVTDADGHQIPGKEMITTATGVQAAYDVVTEDNGDIIVVGKNSFENNSMISFFKIRF